MNRIWINKGLKLKVTFRTVIRNFMGYVIRINTI